MSRLGSPRTKIWLLTAAGLLPLLTVVWLLGSWVGARSADLWVLRLGLGAACVALAVGVGAWLQGRLPKEQPAQLGGDELDTIVAAAKARLAASRAAGTASLGELPLVLLLGPASAAKTSTVVHSGLDPDLLAGEVFHGDRITPTGWVNLWYTQKTILLEVGAKVAGDAGRWQRLLRYARPSRLRALLPGRAQAARAVVVCFSCEELVKPGSATAVPAAAAELRKVLVELAQEFGIRLPVYVLFTKADRIPFFAEYVRNLSRDETREVLGATLTWPPATGPGLYGEREFQRINAALERLYQSLADKRVPLLARESDTARRGDTYEFPREVRKLVPVASQFLLELCRPSQLQVNPVLRGFYFTGVRPVVVRDAGPPVPASAAPGRGRVGATQTFDAAEPSAGAAGQPVDVGGRKVPEWLFLGRLFREVFLGDRVAPVAALGSLRVNLLRRVALSTVAAFFVVWLLGQPISCVNNRTLAARAVGSLRDLRVASPREGELADLDALRNLDAGRAQLERLADYERHGPPLRMRFGLYQGSRLYDQLGKTYLSEFGRVLLEPTRHSLQRALRTTVDSGGTSPRAFELLRAYLMTTTRPDRIEAPFLTPILVRQWQGTWQVDSQRRGLAEQQFDFYAAKLCPAGACPPDRADQETVNRARNFLKDFTAPEALYQQMVAQANDGNRGVRFTAEALFDSLEVPGAFTPAGWDAAVRFLDDEDNFLTENWVLEQQTVADPSRIQETLRSLYRQEYVRQWRRFLEAAVLASFSRGNAGDRLKELAAPQTSPLVRVLALVARNTDVDRDHVGRFFQPVHVLAPPGAKDSTTELMKPYFSALRELQVLVEDAATAAPAEAQQLSEKIAQSARAARTSVGQLEDIFRPEGEGVAVAAAVGKLLGTPIDRVDGLMRGLPGMAVNSIAERFCRAFDPLTSHFPFNAAGTDVDFKDFGAMFQPEEGELWRFYTDALRDVLVRSGSQFTARQGSRVSQTFLAFFNRAAAVSAALWKPGSPEPQFDFVLLVQPPAGAPRVTLSMSGQRAVWEQRLRRVGTFRWMGEPGQVALTAQLRGVETDLRTFNGVWAIFRLFRDATGWRPAAGESGSYLVQFNYPDRGVALDAQLNVAGRTPILKPDFFGGMRCVRRVIQ